MIRALALLLVLALPARAEEAPSVEVTLDPAGPVTVGTPVAVALTVLVPTYMPQPPDWPDPQIADAITRLPARATTPVTRRVGADSWSGLVRTYEIVPQRAADYALAGLAVGLTWAGADGSPQQATLPVPDIAFSATVPSGAEDLDPFLPASALAVEAAAEGLPEAPKPGDALTLTLTTTASGPPAMLLPPLAGRIATPAGLRAYPREPVLTDTPGERGAPPTATRVESVTYVVESPGRYVLPATSLRWWNTDEGAVETAGTDAVGFDVPPPPGWKAPGREAQGRPGRLALALGLAAAAACAAGLALWRRGRAGPRPRQASERRVYRDLRRKVRHAAPGSLRTSVLDWTRRAAPDAPGLTPEVETALLAVERSAFGVPAAAAQERRATDPARDALLSALAARRRALRPRRREAAASHLPPLNPPAIRAT